MSLLSFFKALQAENAEIVMLGGAQEPTVLNAWALIGVGIRQQVTLKDELQSALANARTWGSEGLPFHGGLVACFGYEFYHHCDSAFTDRHTPDHVAGWPTVLAQECEDWLVMNLETQELTVLSDSIEQGTHYQTLWQQHRKQPDPSHTFETRSVERDLNGWHTSFDEETFSAAVDTIKQAIVDGELYQANLSMRFEKELAIDPLNVFETLCAKNPSPFSGYWQNKNHILISNSPERLFRLQDRLVETRPIAGTRSRGKSPAEEQALRNELLSNEKERAEHMMLVDLERNDLGRVCEAGSVEVNELLTLESYSHVTHLVSNIQGRLKKEKTVWDVLRATFPGGTITGCPKIRCINLLDKLEPAPRGFYTGSLGYIDALTGNADFNILIRSLLLTAPDKTAEKPPLRYNARIQAGAGIVADSIGTCEYRESLKKAHAILGALHACEHRPASI